MDMKYLYEEGHKVLGVEIADEAIGDFFSGNAISHTVSVVKATKKGSSANLFTTNDKNLNIIQNNFLTLDWFVFLHS